MLPKLSIQFAHFSHVPDRIAALFLGTGVPSSFAHTVTDKSSVAVDSTPRVPMWGRDTLVGRSGKLWMKLMTPRGTDSTSVLARLFGDSAVRRPGIYAVRESSAEFHFEYLVSCTEKQKVTLGTY